MSGKKTVLRKMKANPKGDWQIKDIQRLCDEIGLELRPPTGGSHYKVSSSHLRDIVTVPARRPIKPVYIKTITSYAEAHIEREGSNE